MYFFSSYQDPLWPAFRRWCKVSSPEGRFRSPVSCGTYILVVGGSSREVCCINIWYYSVNFLYTNTYSQSTFCVHEFLSSHLAAEPWNCLAHGNSPLATVEFSISASGPPCLSPALFLWEDIASFVSGGIEGNFSFWWSFRQLGSLLIRRTEAE